MAGYSMEREKEYGGLFVVRDADGNKVGTAQSEAAARLVIRNARRREEREREAAYLGRMETQEDRDTFYDLDR